MMTTKIWHGLRDGADHYDGFIIDLWGVLHNGSRAYDGAIAALRALRARGKKIVLLSNSPGRAADTAATLRQLGITDAFYDDLITSGEMTIAAAKRGDFGARGFCYGADEPAVTYAVAGVALTEDWRDADYVLNVWLGDEGDEVAALPDLRAWAARGLLMICANPDLAAPTAGGLVLCAGTLAGLYEQQGGRVRYIGKPYEPAFAAAKAALGVGDARTLMIGDGLETDVKGAQAAGIDSVWIMGGKHLSALGGRWGGVADPAAVARLTTTIGVTPGFALSHLFW